LFIAADTGSSRVSSPEVERTTVISAQPFGAVVAKLETAIGHPDVSAFADVSGARTSTDLERIVNATTGAVGLMEMA
jgi:hypothetical protein